MVRCGEGGMGELSPPNFLHSVLLQLELKALWGHLHKMLLLQALWDH